MTSSYLTRPIRATPAAPTVTIIRNAQGVEIGRAIKSPGFRFAVWRGRTLIAYLATLDGARAVLSLGGSDA